MQKLYAQLAADIKTYKWPLCGSSWYNMPLKLWNSQKFNGMYNNKDTELVYNYKMIFALAKAGFMLVLCNTRYDNDIFMLLIVP